MKFDSFPLYDDLTERDVVSLRDCSEDLRIGVGSASVRVVEG